MARSHVLRPVSGLVPFRRPRARDQTAVAKDQPPRDKAPDGPARRLGLFYIASLTAIALLWYLGQWYVVQELQAQGSNIQEMVRAAERRVAPPPFSQPALRLLWGDSDEERRGALESLRQRVREAPAATEDLSVERARSRAQELVDWCDQRGLGSLDTHALQGKVAELVAAEGDQRGALDSSLDRMGSQAMARLARLQTLESLLCVYVVSVLLLEGMFVVMPAIRDITRHTETLNRSNAVLRDYATRLERSNKELQEFASVASHDLQEPLRKVQAFSDRLKRRSGSALDEQGVDHLNRIQNAAGRMQTLINDLLTYSRVTTKAQPFAPVDLTASVRDVVGDLEARIESTRGRVDVKDLPTIDADSLQVRQLFQNLIGNALKYHRPDSPPVVRVSAGPPPSQGPGEEFGRESIHIHVQDNGIGFDDQYRERIFQMFQRLHGREEYEGTGVGLAVCRKIVERHGGSITARGMVGQGATFVVTLPVSQTQEAPGDA